LGKERRKISFSLLFLRKSDIIYPINFLELPKVLSIYTKIEDTKVLPLLIFISGGGYFFLC
ncbi:hypothetical protein ACTJ5V_11960, partial [Streptococcus suis]|uniref:hypothetical protein n=1 Tax=Streptococcus suis TaxID=1307 RepID=UPI003F89C724